jgi:NADH:ubiquinone oxidoreductase subunit 6 (subunit J)
MDIQLVLIEVGAVGMLVVFLILLWLNKRQTKVSNLTAIFMTAAFLSFFCMAALVPFVQIEYSTSSGAIDDK